MSALDIVATIVARPGRGDEVAAMLAAALETVRAEKGCERYDLFRVRRDPDTLVMLERWTSKDDLVAHGSSQHFGELSARMADDLAEPPVVRVLDPVAQVAT